MFTEALHWEHGVDFIFVAFQNRVAHAMGGTTLHSGGDITVGGQRTTNVSKSDVDNLFTKNQHIRWLLIDEVGMIADELLGAFDSHLTDAAVQCRFSKRVEQGDRPFGGYNMLAFGDLFQIPPIPSSGSISIPTHRKTEHARKAVNLFYGEDANALNYFAELTIQKRIDDPWYAQVLEECREGFHIFRSDCERGFNKFKILSLF